MQDCNEDLKALVSDKEIDAAWGNADFGSQPKREVIKEALLKYACNYVTGKTSTSILLELELIKADNKYRYSLSKRGQRYLWLAFASEQW